MRTVSSTYVKYFISLLKSKWSINYAIFEKFAKELVLELEPAKDLTKFRCRMPRMLTFLLLSRPMVADRRCFLGGAVCGR